METRVKRLNLGSQAGLLFIELGKCQVGTEKSVKQIKFLFLSGESNTPTKMLLGLRRSIFLEEIRVEVEAGPSSSRLRAGAWSRWGPR